MVQTLEGIYRNGAVQLREAAPQMEEARVLVIFLPPNESEVKQREEERQAAIQRMIARMEKGYNLGGPPYPTREELHDRFDRD